MARILVADDEESIRSLLRHILECAGYEVVDAENGQVALEKCREQRPDLVLTDIVMPEMEGIGFMLQLRREYPGLKVIAMSGGGRIGPETYLPMAREFGAVHTLEKPFRRDDVLSAVENAFAA